MAKQSTFTNMVLCLFVVCLVCSGLLAGVHTLTASAIAQAEQNKKEQAVAAVLPEFDNSPLNESISFSFNGEDCVVYPAQKDGSLIGYAIQSDAVGFGGKIALMVGISADGRIFGTSTLSQAETPGLGAKITSDAKFIGQWKDIDAASFRFAVKKDGGDVDAITASTITSRAYTKAVQKAYEIFKSIPR
ncbi:MAG: RnfABCDGE type electron transport complex subunit G [Bacteroidales bacterium]|nr:RnfABCDGE type electron transport complex subunit G [Bacteroidales bacterium]